MYFFVVKLKTLFSRECSCTFAFGTSKIKCLLFKLCYKTIYELNQLEGSDSWMRKHVNFQITSVLEEFLASGTANYSWISTMNFFGVSLQSCSRAKKFWTHFTLKVSKNFSHVYNLSKSELILYHTNDWISYHYASFLYGPWAFEVDKICDHKNHTMVLLSEDLHCNHMFDASPGNSISKRIFCNTDIDMLLFLRATFLHAS